jgi:N6-adenosine-specific RNA methylase IME4
MKYGVIYADPPWSYGDKGFGKRPEDGTVKGSFAPEAGRYPTMALAEIAAMHVSEIAAMHVSEIAAPDCALLLWATSPLLPEALQIIKAWGFKFKTIAFCWSKITTTGKEVANLGQWTMGNVELCLLGTRGSPTRMRRDIRQLVTAERTEHSRKPKEVRSRIEAIFGEVPKVELFSRGAAPGWDSWGNQAQNPVALNV